MIVWIKLIGRSLCLGLSWTATYFLSASGQKRNVLLLCLLSVAQDIVACPPRAGPYATAYIACALIHPWVFGSYRVHVSDRRPAILTDVRAFPQSLQAIAGIVPQINPLPLLSYPLQFIIYPITRRKKCELLTVPLNKPQINKNI
jgi:hypothetical protein